ncbi:hypothetical protein GCM10009107_55310 [Ideonella azotifigens]|uniref:Response regulatory domain-containing protein n=1 Tax=Ideonella azotifigens TaxID=513160 RepID=A0ABP3VQW7_9BURK
MLVDDSMAIQQSLTRLLASVPGLEVIGCAATSEDALSLIATARPDVVVLDVDLGPGGRGMDVLRQASQNHPAVKFMMLSNYGWQAMRTGFMDAGAEAYFDKGSQFMQARAWLADQATK